MNQQRETVLVNEVRGISAKQRVTVQDVEARPPRLYTGTVSSVWSDETAMIIWDDNRFVPERDKHLVLSGRVNLHHVRAA